MEGFGYLLAHFLSFGSVYGIVLPNSSSYLVIGHFSSDSFLSLLEDDDYIANALHFLDIFCQALGLAIQWHKMLYYK